LEGLLAKIDSAKRKLGIELYRLFKMRMGPPRPDLASPESLLALRDTRRCPVLASELAQSFELLLYGTKRLQGGGKLI